MTDAILVLVQQIASMFLMIAVGFALFRRGTITKEGSAQLCDMALYVATPALILMSFAVDFSWEKLANAFGCVAASLVVTVLAVVVGHLVWGRSHRVARFATCFSNIGFIGIPIVQSLLGIEYVFYASAAMAVNTLTAWTYGAYLVSDDIGNASVKEVLRNPAVIAILVGMVIFVLPIELPRALTNSLDMFGSMNTGLAMLVLGTYLAQVDFGDLLRSAEVYLICAMRLLAVPAVTLALLAVLPLSLEIKVVVVVFAATPVGALVSMLSQKFEQPMEQVTFGSGLVAVSTLFSAVTLPVVLGATYLLFG